MKKKICLILIFAILFAFIVGSRCFAFSESSVEYEGTTYYFDREIKNNYSRVCMFKGNNNKFYYFLCNFGNTPHLDNRNNLFVINHDVDICCVADTFEDAFYLRGTIYNNETSSSSQHDTISISKPSNIDLIFSNCDIYTYDSSYNIDESNPTYTKTYNLSYIEYNELSSIYQNTGLGGVLSEVVSILPIVLVVIISFIGIRKGIAFIQKLLRKS